MRYQFKTETDVPILNIDVLDKCSDPRQAALAESALKAGTVDGGLSLNVTETLRFSKWRAQLALIQAAYSTALAEFAYEFLFSDGARRVRRQFRSIDEQIVEPYVCQSKLMFPVTDAILGLAQQATDQVHLVALLPGHDPDRTIANIVWIPFLESINHVPDHTKWKSFQGISGALHLQDPNRKFHLCRSILGRAPDLIISDEPLD